MKKILIPALVFSSLLTATSFAAPFSLDKVQAIECSEPQKFDKKMDVYLTTNSSATDKYMRDSGSLPYEYGNKAVYGFSSGVFTLTNNPDQDGGRIELSDTAGLEPAILVLTPTTMKGLYVGELTGLIENVNNDWVTMKKRQLACLVTF